VITKKSNNNHVERMSKTAFLNERKKVFLSQLHTRKDYKKNPIIDQQGTISKSGYYLNEVVFSMEY
jgi:hypothetical protein